MSYSCTTCHYIPFTPLFPKKISFWFPVDLQHIGTLGFPLKKSKKFKLSDNSNEAYWCNDHSGWEKSELTVKGVQENWIHFAVHLIECLKV